jgi:homoserine O-acetyltransferase/O-succinyltransferase
MNDPDWNHGDYERQPANGLALARMIGMISYRSGAEFEQRFGSDSHQIESYLRYQGEKLVSRFDANTYLYLTRAMDSHDIARGRNAQIKCKICCIGFSSDTRYPISDQQDLVDQIPNAELHILNSIHGHDSFLIEFEAMSGVIQDFMERRL